MHVKPQCTWTGVRKLGTCKSPRVGAQSDWWPSWINAWTHTELLTKKDCHSRIIFNPLLHRKLLLYISRCIKRSLFLIEAGSCTVSWCSRTLIVHCPVAHAARTPVLLDIHKMFIYYLPLSAMLWQHWTRWLLPASMAEQLVNFT